ncbi:MAG: gliding motility-associated C-terminal domain-containing protein [Chitinophagales bacterium]
MSIFKLTSVLFFLCLSSGLFAQGACPAVDITNTPSVSCYGSSDGSATANVSGGSGNFSYSWSTGANTPSINFLPAGIYYVDVLDLNTGCKVFDLAVIDEPDQLTSNLSITDVLCYGENTGAIDLTVNGGTQPYNYSWDNGSNSEDLNGISAGSYSVTVTDANGCSASFDAVVTQPNTPLGATITGTDPACRGDFNGSVILEVFGGTPAYDFNWNGGTYLTQNLNNVPAGTYTVTVRDDNNCVVNKSVTLTDPPVLSSNFTKQDITCYGETDGSIDLTVNGGTPPYSFDWVNSTYDLSYSTEDINNLPADDYTVEITDSRGCKAFNTITITEPAAPLSATINKQNVSCFGDSDGSATITASGGTPPYSYLWANPPSINPGISSLQAGIYHYTVTDIENCTYIDSVEITEPSAPLSLAFDTDSVSCAQGNDGAIDLTVNGGTAPYSYNWNSGTFTTEDISGLFAGNYDVLVTDDKGCTETGSVTIHEPGVFIVQDSITDVDCFGNNTGAIDLNVSGGTLPYSYQWNSSSFSLGHTSRDIDDLFADTYYLEITDANNCVYVDSFVVDEPDLLSTSVQITNVNCHGGSDGEIDLTVNGGVMPYSYQWSNSLGTLPNTSQDLLNIPAEEYEVTVTDFNGCTIQQSAIVTEPQSPLVSTITKTNVSCYGGNDGTASLQVSGGTAPYSISWSNGSSSQNLSGLVANIYTVLIVDANGCQANNQVIINQPSAPLESNFQVTNVPCYGQENGSVITTITGGTPPYSFAWVNSDYVLSESSRNLIDFPADVYILTTTDDKSCELIDTVEITEPPELIVEATITNILCYGDNSGAIDLDVSGGVSPYIYNWSNGASSEDLQNIPAGWYTITVTDANNCERIDSFNVSQPTEALGFDKEVTATKCFGGSDGRIIFLPLGGTAPYDFTWSNTDTTAIVSNLTSGFYQVTLTDANNCTLIDSVFVPHPDRIQINDSINPVRCYGESSGDIFLNITGGTGPYFFRWSNSEFQLNYFKKDLLDMPTDEYSVELRDSNNCRASASFFLYEPDTLLPNTDIKRITCTGTADGGIGLYPEGGNPPYSYSWNTGSNDSVLSNLDEALYVYTIRDRRGCENIDSIYLSNPDTIRFNAEVEPVSCLDQTDGSITLDPKNGHGAYEFEWSNGDFGNPLQNLAGGEYTVTITDYVGCSRDSIIVLPVIEEECLDIPNSFTPNGDGRNDVWMMENLHLYPEIIVRIFNRWGNLVFESKGYSQPWNGERNGQPLPSDTYYYVIDLNNDTKPKSGSITIVR